MNAKIAPELEKVARASRRSAFLSATGFVIVILAFTYSSVIMNQLTARQQQMSKSISSSRSALQSLTAANSSAETRSAALRAEYRQLEDQASKLKHYIDTNQAELARQAAGELGTGTPAVAPLVYFQTNSREQAPLYEACAAVLKSQGMKVPRDELVPDRRHFPGRTEVRYFHPDEEAKAGQIVQMITACAKSPATAKRIAGYDQVPANQFEVWIAPPVPASP